MVMTTSILNLNCSESSNASVSIIAENINALHEISLFSISIKNKNDTMSSISLSPIEDDNIVFAKKFNKNINNDSTDNDENIPISQKIMKNTNNLNLQLLEIYLSNYNP